jgi:two-component system, OmpR family, response regulator RegX3
MVNPGGPAAPNGQTHPQGDGTGQSATLLVAEDDEGSRLALARSLERYGYRVIEAADGEVALQLFQANPMIDLVVLDIGLPRLDGFAVLSRLRQLSDVPVIMLTGRGEEVDRVVGLELGADDYVLKPYSLRELVARVRARLRRRPSEERRPAGAEPLVFGDLVIDPRAREVHIADEKIDLTAREYELFAFLASHPREVFSREELLEHVWGTRFQDPATVTEHVRRVRAKIEQHPPSRKLLTTLRGMGYRFDP